MTRKNWLLNMLALLIPVVFFVGVEGVLRLVGYGDDYPLFIPVSSEPTYLYQNPEVARRYFKKQQRVPTSQRDYFKAEKDSTTFRIFVQGGSSAAGYPLFYGGSFSRMLEQRLLQTFPGRNIEVINTAMSAVNSYTLRDFVDEIIDQDPDLILIYAGHNEYYGSLGVGSAESLGRFVGLVNVYLNLQHLRIMQALQQGLTTVAGIGQSESESGAAGTTLMSRLVQEQEIPYASPLYHMGITQFERNLGVILDTYKKEQIPVMIGTLASNEKDQAPFVTNPAPGTDETAWDTFLKTASAALAEQDTARALESVNTSIAVDSLAALGFYIKGRILFDQGKFAEAREAFVKAKDRDQLRFRAPEEINEVIRDLAEQYEAIVVETQGALRNVHSHGIIGHELMLEHLHPNLEGYFLMADAYYDAMRENELIGDWDTPVPANMARNEVLFTKVDSLVAQYRVSQLMNSWPFKPFGTITEGIQVSPTSSIEEIAWSLYNNDIGWYEAINQLRSHYESQGDYLNALRASLAVIQEYPFAAPPYLATASILIKQGRVDEALNYIEAANEREETAIGLSMKGSILLQRQDAQGAIDILERSVDLDGANQQTLFALSGAYYMTEKFEDARRTLEQLLDVNPNHVEARRILERLNASS